MNYWTMGREAREALANRLREIADYHGDHTAADIERAAEELDGQARWNPKWARQPSVARISRLHYGYDGTPDIGADVPGGGAV